MGASGLIGTMLVELLTREGEDVVAASRRSGADVLSGAGLAVTERVTIAFFPVFIKKSNNMH